MINLKNKNLGEVKCDCVILTLTSQMTIFFILQPFRDYHKTKSYYCLQCYCILLIVILFIAIIIILWYYNIISLFVILFIAIIIILWYYNIISLFVILFIAIIIILWYYNIISFVNVNNVNSQQQNLIFKGLV